MRKKNLDGVLYIITALHSLWSKAYRISANSFRVNYSFLNLALCTVTFGYST